MKYILYMAITANGYIAKANGESDWSDAEIASYTAMVRTKKNVVMGSKTYEMTKNYWSFKEVGDSPVFTITSNPEKYTDDANEQFIFIKTIAELETKAAELGFSELLVAGGATINSLFWETGKLDEIYLDVEPNLFGSGIPLFSEIKTEKKMKLIGTKPIGENGIQLHYLVTN